MTARASGTAARSTSAQQRPAKLRVLVVDDHAIVRDGLRAWLTRDGFEVVAGAPTGESAIRAALEHAPDIVVLDLRLPDMSGAAVCSAILSSQPQTAIVVLTAFIDDQLVADALDAGARAYLVKDVENLDLATHLLQVHAGKQVVDPRAAAVLVRRFSPQRLRTAPKVSARALHIVELAAEGLSNREIGARLFLSRHTVKEHMGNAMREFGVTSRLEAVLVASRLGLIQLPEPLNRPQ